MFPLIVVGIFLVCLSFLLASDFGVKAFGENDNLAYGTFFVGLACIIISVILVRYAIKYMKEELGRMS